MAENKDYLNIIAKIKEELPNIVLPSMGILEEMPNLNIEGDFLIKENNEEEQK